MLKRVKNAGGRIGKIALLIFAGTFSPEAAQSSPAPVLDLSAYRGKVIYLDFWASWCAPCLQSFPWMNEIQRTFGRQGLTVIAVNVDRDGNMARQFLRGKIPEFKIVYDPDGAIAKQYDLKDMPTTFLIGQDGKIRYVHSGFYLNRESQYVSHIRELLNEVR